MSFRFNRVPSRWLRVALVAVVLGFGLNTIAHVGHAHDAASTSSQNVSCGYCLYFGHLADPARHTHHSLPSVADIHVALPRRALAPSRVPDRSAQPRAPPHLKI